MWGEQDSNLRSHKTTELQSVPVGRFGIPPSILLLELFLPKIRPIIRPIFKQECKSKRIFILFKYLTTKDWSFF